MPAAPELDETRTCPSCGGPLVVKLTPRGEPWGRHPGLFPKRWKCERCASRTAWIVVTAIVALGLAALALGIARHLAG